MAAAGDKGGDKDGRIGEMRSKFEPYKIAVHLNSIIDKTSYSLKSIKTGSGDSTPTGTPETKGKGIMMGETRGEEAIEMMIMHIRKRSKRITSTQISILTKIHEIRIERHIINRDTEIGRKRREHWRRKRRECYKDNDAY